MIQLGCCSSSSLLYRNYLHFSKTLTSLVVLALSLLLLCLKDGEFAMTFLFYSPGALRALFMNRKILDQEGASR